MKIIMTIAIATMTTVTGDKIIIETIVVMDTNMVEMIVVTIAPTIAMIAPMIGMIVLTIVMIAPTIAMIALTIVMIALTIAPTIAMIALMIVMIVQTIAGVIMIVVDDMAVVAIVDTEIVAERGPGSKSRKQNTCQIITKSIARDTNLNIDQYIDFVIAIYSPAHLNKIKLPIRIGQSGVTFYEHKAKCVGVTGNFISF